MDIILFLLACGLAVLASGLARENNELRETIEKQQEIMLEFLTELSRSNEKPMQGLCRILHGSVLEEDRVSGMVPGILR